MLTVRRALLRRTRVMMAIVFGGALLTVILAQSHDPAFPAHHHFAMAYRRTLFDPWIWGGALLSCAMALIWHRTHRIRCPNCGGEPANFRERQFEITEKLMFGEGLSHCPHCDASLDVPMPT